MTTSLCQAVITSVFRLWYFLQAENDLRIAQSDFDRQTEIIKLLLEGISSTHVGVGVHPLPPHYNPTKNSRSDEGPYA